MKVSFARQVKEEVVFNDFDKMLKVHKIDMCI